MSFILENAYKVFDLEIAALKDVRKRIGEDFIRSVELVHACQGKVILTGMGKSGLVGRKISSTLSSVGSPSLFLHPGEGLHGDLGVVQSQDVVIAISQSGESDELFPLLKFCKNKNMKLIAFTGNKRSALAKAANYVVDTSVEQEACPIGQAPMSSTTVSLVLGDALAACTLIEKGFTEADFATLHPGGRLGRKLLLRVQDVMYPKNSLPLVRESASLLEVLTRMTEREVKGVVGVVDEKQHLLGVVTDGDIRRFLKAQGNFTTTKVCEIMNVHPKTIDVSDRAIQAQFLMEQCQIEVLFVVNKKENPRIPLGLVSLFEVLKQL